jgi:hypothetical protein
MHVKLARAFEFGSGHQLLVALKQMLKLNTLKKFTSTKHFQSTAFSTSFSSRAKPLVVAEHDNGKLSPGTLNSISAASSLGPVDVLVVGSGQACQAVAEAVSWAKGVQTVFVTDDAAFAHPTAEALCAV